MEGGLFQLCLINIHHNDLGSSCPGLPVVAHLTDGDAGAHSQDQIRVLDRPVTGPVTHIARTANVQRMVILDQINGIPIGYHRDVQLIGNTAKCLIAAGQADTVAGMEYGALRVFELFQDGLYHIVADWRR